MKGDLEHRRMLDVLQLKNHMHSTGKIPYGTLHRLVDVRDLPYNYMVKMIDFGCTASKILMDDIYM